MSLSRHGSWAPDPQERAGHDIVEERRATRSGVLAEATLACPHCDAPIAVGPEPLLLGHSLTCPVCTHGGPVRDFLSLDQPTRAAHVVLRVRFSPR